MRFPSIKYPTLLCLLLWAGTLWGQFQIPEKPPVSEQTSLYDYVGLLSEGQERQLREKLIRYSDSTSTQIVIAIIATTEGEDIQYLGAQWGHAWGIGQEQEDNGILILLARDDRRIAINTGYGVEEFLTDVLSRRIIERVIIPEFKNGDYYAGLDKGADAIFEVLTGQFQGGGQGPTRFPFEVLIPFLLFILLIIILASRNKRGGGRGTRRKGLDIWDVIILSNMGRSGSSGGGFGGGGFGGGGFSGGFGGGGFGGGGASGGW